MDHGHEPRETVFEVDEHKVPSAGAITLTYLALVGLAAAQLAVGFSPLGDIKALVALAIAATQVAVLALYFMDLRQADALTWLSAGASVFFVGLMFLFILTDYVTRQLAAY